MTHSGVVASCEFNHRQPAGAITAVCVDRTPDVDIDGFFTAQPLVSEIQLIADS
jgi:hypothetical protein